MITATKPISGTFGEIYDEQPITVLADESLGGVLREYCEIKRKARVGDIVKYPDDCRIARVVSDSQGDTLGIGSADYTYESTANNPTHKALVLEPSDIIRINNERLRMVERKAAVGERIVALVNGPAYGNPTRGTVQDVTYVFVDGSGIGTDVSLYEHGEYRVLEPVNASAQQPVTLVADTALIDLARQVNGLTETVAKLALKVTELERKGSDGAYVEVASGPVSTRLPSFARPLTRDEVIEKAKRDIEAVKKPWEGYDNSPQYIVRNHICDVEFIVNRNKRTVVAILRWRYDNAIKAKGIARCEPADCFNVHIGKAIALRRALGLEVPAEYVTAPQPTEARVGDIVTGYAGIDDSYYSVDKRFTLTHKTPRGSFKYAENTGDWIAPEQIGRIVDDSRTEVSE